MAERKIVPFEVAAAHVDAMRRGGWKIVHCHGCFDLLHIGHVKHLQAARRMGDFLIVTVTPDRYVNKGPGRPAFTERLRAEALAALDCVDLVTIAGSPTAVDAIRLFRPDYYVKGQEFEMLPQLPARLGAEIDAVRELGGQVRFTHEEVFSSTALLKDHETRMAAGPAYDAARRFLDGFRARHAIDDVLASLASLRDLRVLVIGETILDEYCYCEPLGKSPTATIVTMKQQRQERHAGGALAYANHIAGFCRAVELVTLLGEEDAQEPFVRAHLRPNVTPRFVIRPDVPTITKRRYFLGESLVKLFEVARLDDTPLSAALEEAMLGELHATLGEYDVTIVADYGHGFLGPRAAALLGDRARFLAVNTQANAANLGFNLITKYPRIDFACLNEPELRLATGDPRSPVDQLVAALHQRLAGTAIAVTRSDQGSILCAPDGRQWDVPALSQAVVDPMGAGDAYLALTAPCVASGMPMDVVGLIGGIAGALAVQIVGNRSAIDPAAVRQFVATLLR
jgi:rfaE bifunctional protein nucleotidyltransferase chain/domain